MSTWQIMIINRGHPAVLAADLVNDVVVLDVVCVPIGVGTAHWLADHAAITIVISALHGPLHCHCLHLAVFTLNLLSLRLCLIYRAAGVFTWREGRDRQFQKQIFLTGRGCDGDKKNRVPESYR